MSLLDRIKELLNKQYPTINWIWALILVFIIVYSVTN